MRNDAELVAQTESGDRMIPILRGLQRLYSQSDLRQQVLDGLQKVLALVPQLASLCGILGWRQAKSMHKKAKQAAVQASQASVEFRQSQRKHSGIESAIGALQSGNGLARCRDRSQIGCARYIGLGVLGHNILTLGKLLLSREDPDCFAAKRLRQAA